MDVTTKLYAKDRQEWRAWLEAHHGLQTEIWLVYLDNPDSPSVSYLDSTALDFNHLL